ncbi:MAG: hypothetical protein JWP24_1612 [Marmoricola sp.]|jgi:hypothetical protein|nr:hypothetical protein [Marmoricola sp.]
MGRTARGVLVCALLRLRRRRSSPSSVSFSLKESTWARSTDLAGGPRRSVPRHVRSGDGRRHRQGQFRRPCSPVGAFRTLGSAPVWLTLGVSGVEDVLLEQGEEALRGGVVAGRGDAAHRAAEAVVVQDPDDLFSSEIGCPCPSDRPCRPGSAGRSRSRPPMPREWTSCGSRWSSRRSCWSGAS